MLKVTKKLLFFASLFGLLPSSIFALECTENNCKYFRLGVGGAYHSLSISPTDSQNADTSSIGGYLAFTARGVLKSRLASELGGKIGLGSAKSEGNYFQQTDSKSPLSVFLDWYFKLGLNIASARVPLFVNVAYGYDNFSTNANNKGIGLSRNFIGGEVDGFIPTNSGSRLEYLVGYYHFLYADYTFANNNTTHSMKSNYMIKASVGYAGNITPQLGYYAKLIGKYEDTLSKNTLLAKM